MTTIVAYKGMISADTTAMVNQVGDAIPNRSIKLVYLGKKGIKHNKTRIVWMGVSGDVSVINVVRYYFNNLTSGKSTELSDHIKQFNNQLTRPGISMIFLDSKGIATTAKYHSTKGIYNLTLVTHKYDDVAIIGSGNNYFNMILTHFKKELQTANQICWLISRFDPSSGGACMYVTNKSSLLKSMDKLPNEIYESLTEIFKSIITTR